MEIQQKCTKPRVFIIVYRPPQGRIDECIESFRNILSHLNSNAEIFLIGDLNINYLEKNLKSVKELKALEREFNLKQQISRPTRVTATTETLLDHIYMKSMNVMIKGIIENHLSDHYPIYLVTKKQPIIF